MVEGELTSFIQLDKRSTLIALGEKIIQKQEIYYIEKLIMIKEIYDIEISMSRKILIKDC